MLTKLATTALLVVVARVLGDAEFGLLSSVLAASALCGIVQEAGLTVPLIRRVAGTPSAAGRAVGEVLSLKLALALPAVVGFVAFGWTLEAPLPGVLLFALSMALEVMSVSLLRSFEGVEAVADIGRVLLVERTILVVAGCGAVVAGWGLTGLGAAYAAAFGGSMASAVVLWRKRGQPVTRGISRRRAAVLLREAVPFVLAGVLGLVYSRIDVLLLTAWGSPAAVGWFTAGARVTEAAFFLPSALTAMLFPVLARTASSDWVMFRRMSMRSAAGLFALGAVAGVITWTLADVLTGLLYGAEFAPTSGLLRILSWMVPLYFLNLFLGTALIAMHRERYSTVTLAAGAVAGTGLNAMLIPAWGVDGAAYARVWTEVVCAVVQGVLFWMSLRAAPPTSHEVAE